LNNIDYCDLIKAREILGRKLPEGYKIRVSAPDSPLTDEDRVLIRAQFAASGGRGIVWTIDRLISKTLLSQFLGDKTLLVCQYFLGAIEAWAKNHD
jgi:hypothetical protein